MYGEVVLHNLNKSIDKGMSGWRAMESKGGMVHEMFMHDVWSHYFLLVSCNPWEMGWRSVGDMHS